MRTAIIPAQITTVEDKIAGNLSLTQILILMVPLFWITLLYAVFPPKLHMIFYKIPLSVIVLFLSFTLALRVKGKVIFHWLIILFKFNLRPKYYIFNKNDDYLRVFESLNFKEEDSDNELITVEEESVIEVENRSANIDLSISDLAQFEHLLEDPNYSLSFKTSKGGLNVSLEQVKA